jgi:hypothetical protein
MILWRAEFSSSFWSANFAVILVRYMHAPEMTTDKLEHDEKWVAKRTEKESI